MLEIESLKLHSFMSENNIPTDSRSLQRLIEKVDTLSPSVLPSFVGIVIKPVSFEMQYSTPPGRQTLSRSSLPKIRRVLSS